MNLPTQIKKGATSVYGKAYTFRADPQKAELLEIFGTDTVTLANNHVYDYGKRGFLSTLDVLDQEGIPYSGAGRNLKDASKIIYYVMNGRKVAFVSATQIERSKQYTKAATETEPGVLKALHPEKFLKNSRGGSTKQRLCDRRSALGNRGDAFIRISHSGIWQNRSHRQEQM